MFFDNSKYFVFEKIINSSSGKEIKIYSLNNSTLDDNILNEWATGLRWNYVDKELLNDLISGTGLTCKEFLKKNIIPDKPSTMSGEFGEILVLDFLNFVLNFYVTRTRYFEKNNRNMPVPGSDVIGYKVMDVNTPSSLDNLIVAEVKTRSTKSGSKKSTCEKTVKSAIVHSSKDKIRLSESLNAEKRRLLDRKKKVESKIIERFQNKTDNQYITDFIAVAVLDSEWFLEQVVSDAVDSLSDDFDFNKVLIIHSEKLKEFVVELYGRASEC